MPKFMPKDKDSTLPMKIIAQNIKISKKLNSIKMKNISDFYFY